MKVNLQEANRALQASRKFARAAAILRAAHIAALGGAAASLAIGGIRVFKSIKDK